MHSRGKIYDVARATQLRDFSGLRFARGITPTDVDCLLEFGDRAYVVIEAKSGGAEVPFGQRTALQRMIKAWRKAEKIAVVIVATHQHPPEEAIDFANCRVLEHYEGVEWSKRARGQTVGAFTRSWLKQNGLIDFV